MIFSIQQILQEAKKYNNKPIDIAREIVELFADAKFSKSLNEDGKIIYTLQDLEKEWGI